MTHARRPGRGDARDATTERPLTTMTGTGARSTAGTQAQDTHRHAPRKPVTPKPVASACPAGTAE